MTDRQEVAHDRQEVAQSITAGAARLSAAGIPGSRLDAEVLMAHALDLATFASSLDRRQAHEPVAYITGVKEFWSRTLRVTPAVLIPRPETETVVERVLDIARMIPTPLRILDLCTGSGCIAAALATELPHATFVATDISAAALDIARENLAFASERITFLSGDLFEPLHHRTIAPLHDIITANPPYIADDEWDTLPRDITHYEPKRALVAGSAGLDVIAKIIEAAPCHLNKGGWLVMEIADQQADSATHLAQRIGVYEIIQLTKDLAGRHRVISLRHG